jgi:hypothetical protein
MILRLLIFLSLQFSFISLKNVMDENTDTDAPNRPSINLSGTKPVHFEPFLYGGTLDYGLIGRKKIFVYNN